MLKFLAVLVAIFAVAHCGEKDVLDLVDDDFSTRIQELDTALVMFYAPWCGHCKRLKPEYAKAAELLKNDDPPIALVKVDCTEGGKDTCSKFGVSGYPTLKIFKGGDVSQDYNGPREANGIVKYMRAQVGPSSKEIKTVEEFKKFIAAKETTIFGFFEKDSNLKKTFTKFADKNREKFRFGHTSAAEVLKEQGETDAVYIFRAKHLDNKFESSSVKFDGSSLDDFVKEEFHGLVGVRTRDSLKDFVNPLVVAYYGVDYEKNPKGTNYWRNRVLKVATEFQGKINFAISAKDDFQHELNEFGYDFAGDKPVILARDAKSLKYKLTEEFSVDSLRNFVTQLLDGELEPYIKSEAVPEQTTPVKIAVAKNFQELITDNGKDTLIEFYAPWCGHCKKLTPIYDELAEKLADEEVVIAKMDATANDVPPEFNVQGFPTLYWLSKDRKNPPIQYQGGREVDDFIKYIAKHSTDGLSGYDRSGKAKKSEL